VNRIAIVGGGPGGLLTAYLIARKYGGECSTTLFEASGSLGGKLRTRIFNAAPVAYESGAAEIYDYRGLGEDPLCRLLDELGLAMRPMNGQTVILGDTLLRDDMDIERHWGETSARAIREFRMRAAELLPLDQWHPGTWRFDESHPWANHTCAELLDTVQDPIARRYLVVATHSDLATEPHLTDGLNGLKNFVLDISGYVAFRAIEGGMSRFAEQLVKRTRAEVMLDARVVRIERPFDASWRVIAAHAGREIADEFDAVVLALPASQLGSIEYSEERLRSAMSEHIAHFDYPGHYLRVSLLFESPFWNAVLSGSWFMVDAFGGACVYDESARYDARGHGVLGFLIAGSDALTLANADETMLVRRVIDSLPADLRPHAYEQLMEGRIHRWCGAVSGRPGGRYARDPHHTHQPDADRLRGLLLVGDYLFDSTLNGVYRSADFATTLLSEHLPAAAASAAEPWR
jgi:monoamine oxidase